MKWRKQQQHQLRKSINRRKVGEGEPTEEITKDPVDEIVHYGGEEVPQGHKDEFDPNAPKGSEEEVPGKPGIKIQIQEKW